MLLPVYTITIKITVIFAWGSSDVEPIILTTYDKLSMFSLILSLIDFPVSGKGNNPPVIVSYK